jgi:hypothetical protein
MVQIHAESLSRLLAKNGKYGSAMVTAFAAAWLNFRRLHAFSTRHTSKARRKLEKSPVVPIGQLGVAISGTGLVTDFVSIT